MKCHYFDNFNFYKDLYGEWERLAYSAHLPYKTLYKIVILKMILLRDTLVYDSENWSTYQPFPVVSIFLCLGTSFVEAVIFVIKVP